MKKLIVYISITADIFPSVPGDLLKLQSATVRLADIDQRSGSEVLHTIKEAIDRADHLVVMIDVEDNSLDISPLFGVLKKCVSHPGLMGWLQHGNHAGLKVFGRKTEPTNFQSRNEMVNFLLSEMRS